MQLKLFVVPIKNVSEKEFVPDGENSFWTFCVEYLDGTAAMTGGGSPGSKVPKVDYKEVLKPEEFEVFSRLRDWRKVTAEKEGVPVYAVLTNGQLAQVVQKKITTKAGLKEIEGVGDARVDKYAEALLRLLAAPSTSTTPLNATDNSWTPSPIRPICGWPSGKPPRASAPKRTAAPFKRSWMRTSRLCARNSCSEV